MHRARASISLQWHEGVRRANDTHKHAICYAHMTIYQSTFTREQRRAALNWGRSVRVF